MRFPGTALMTGALLLAAVPARAQDGGPLQIALAPVGPAALDLTSSDGCTAFVPHLAVAEALQASPIPAAPNASFGWSAADASAPSLQIGVKSLQWSCTAFWSPAGDIKLKLELTATASGFGDLTYANSVTLQSATPFDSIAALQKKFDPAARALLAQGTGQLVSAFLADAKSSAAIAALGKAQGESRAAYIATATQISAALAPAKRDEAAKIFATAFDFYKSGEWGAAVTAFEGGLQTDPANAPAHFYLGETYVRLNQTLKARQQYALAVGFGPQSKEGFLAADRLKPQP